MPKPSQKVFDWQGNQRDLTYLQGKYGSFVIKPAAEGGGTIYKISALRAKVDTAPTLVVRVISSEGATLNGIKVAWYWPDAPEDLDAGPKGGVLPQISPNRCVSGWTNAAGDVGFGMGQGAYYFPQQGQIGPHAAWIHGGTTRSDLSLGLGMLGGTNHDHFDVEFTRFEEDPRPPPGPGPCPKDEILAEVAKIESSLEAIRQLLADV